MKVVEKRFGEPLVRSFRFSVSGTAMSIEAGGGKVLKKAAAMLGMTKRTSAAFGR